MVNGKVATGKDPMAQVDMATTVDILIIKPQSQKMKQKSLLAVGKISEGQGGVMLIQHHQFSQPSLLKTWVEETCLQVCKAIIQTVVKITLISALTTWAEWIIWVVVEWITWEEDQITWEAGLSIWVVDPIIWEVAQITWVGDLTI